MQYRGLFVGLATIDIQYFVGVYPEPNKKIKTQTPDIYVGGPSTNAAVAFSYLNNGAYLATAIGDNPFVSLFENDFSSNSIKLFDIVSGKEFQPIVASVVTSGNGDRNIFTHNPNLFDSTPSVEGLFTAVNPEILLLDGFYPQFSLECAKLANKRNIPVVIDGGSWKPQYLDLLPYVDIAICSADFHPPNYSNTEDVFNFLKAFGINKIAISNGEKSILFKDEMELGEVEIETVKVVDTLGAGDFLHGAFCFYFLQSKNFKVALSGASKLASYTCRFKGTRSWLNNKQFA